MTLDPTPTKVENSRILISAYACRPDKGSEPGVGWNMARELVKHCQEVWVITRNENRSAIATELAATSVPRLHFIYYDLPIWARWWKQGQRGVHLHYYLWQIGAYFAVRKLHDQLNFDLVHHVTYGRYCTPSCLALLPAPFVWGPVGGGESAPDPFWHDFSLYGKLYETLRTLSCWIGEHDPFVKLTIQRSAVAIVATSETSARLSALGVRQIKTILGQTGINQQELAQLEKLAMASIDKPVRFVSAGRLLHWKGFHLGLRAFAQANLKNEYWVVGDGPERQRLEVLAKELEIADQVHFWGELPREKALQILRECDALVHPSLHDFSPTICLEAMAAGRPVICLDLGGPAIQVTPETGVKVSAQTPEQAVQGLAEAMTYLARDSELRVSMGQAGQKRVKEAYGWEPKGEFLAQLYQEVLDRR